MTEASTISRDTSEAAGRPADADRRSAGRDAGHVSFYQPRDRRGGRPRSRRDGGRRRGGGRSGAARVRHHRLVDEHRAADPLPRSVAPGPCRPSRRARRADHRRSRCHTGDVRGRPTRRTDRDRGVLRGSAEDLPADRGSRQHREPRHAAPPLGGEGSRRGGGGDHRVQLPDAARARQARARAGGRVHRRAQGRTGHAVDHACARRADRRPHRHPRRCGQRALRYRPRRSVSP